MTILRRSMLTAPVMGVSRQSIQSILKASQIKRNSNVGRHSYTYTSESHIKKDDIAKFKWFVVPDGTSSKILGITVFPYRSGSKVTYRWENAAICKPNAGCNYDSEVAKRILDVVTSIAND